MDILIMLIVSDKSMVGRERSNLRYIQNIMKLSQDRYNSFRPLQTLLRRPNPHYPQNCGNSRNHITVSVDGKESLECARAKEDLMENVQRDEQSGLKFYLDENWWVVYLPEAASAPSSSSNQAEHHPTNSPITMASQHLQPTLRQTQEVHFMWKSPVEPEEPGQSAMRFLHNQPPEQSIEAHAPFMPQGSDQVTFRPRDISWKYAQRVPDGKLCRVQCNLCGKVVCNISRMKEHLAFTGKTLSCPRATDQIRQEIASYITAKKNSRGYRASLSAGRRAA